jgi:hypothetical protein
MGVNSSSWKDSILLGYIGEKALIYFDQGHLLESYNFDPY